jgi:hypothetical protein
MASRLPKLTDSARRGGIAIFFAAWFGIGLLGISSLGVSHSVPIANPPSQHGLASALLRMRTRHVPFVVHVIYARCSCTERLFRHLVHRGAAQNIEEQILFVGDDPRKRELARRVGYRFREVTVDQVSERLGLDAAPVLFVFDANGRLTYAGGYFDRPAAVQAMDERIVTDMEHGVDAKPLPIYGCAMSAELQKAVDPLGLVYGRR